MTPPQSRANWSPDTWVLPYGLLPSFLDDSGVLLPSDPQDL